MLLKPAKDSLDVCIVVGNIEKTLDFYQRMLGLEKANEVETPFGTVHRLRFGTSIIKVMDPRQPPPKGPVGLEKQVGIRFLSFVIHNLTAVCSELAERGVRFTMPATEVLPGLRVAMVTDPDDNIVEFVELGT